MKDLLALSKKSRIPLREIKKALKIPITICTATTPEEAQRFFAAANITSEKRDKEIAGRKWDELSMKRAENATTLTAAKKAHHTARSSSKAANIALLKWIGFCTTFEEAQRAYDETIDGSEARRVAIQKLYKVF